MKTFDNMELRRVDVLPPARNNLIRDVDRYANPYEYVTQSVGASAISTEMSSEAMPSNSRENTAPPQQEAGYL